MRLYSFLKQGGLNKERWLRESVVAGIRLWLYFNTFHWQLRGLDDLLTQTSRTFFQGGQEVKRFLDCGL